MATETLKSISRKSSYPSSQLPLSPFLFTTLLAEEPLLIDIKHLSLYKIEQQLNLLEELLDESKE